MVFWSIVRTELWHKTFQCNISGKLLQVRVIFQMYQSDKNCVAACGRRGAFQYLRMNDKYKRMTNDVQPI